MVYMGLPTLAERGLRPQDTLLPAAMGAPDPFLDTAADDRLAAAEEMLTGLQELVVRAVGGGIAAYQPVAQAVELLQTSDQALEPHDKIAAHPLFWLCITECLQPYNLDRRRAALQNLGSFAAAAAIKAGREDFSVIVPVCERAVHLPGLGRAYLDSDNSLAVVRATKGAVTISDGERVVTVPQTGQTAPGWESIRRVRLLAGEQALDLEIDDLRPPSENLYSAPNASRLSEERYGEWVRSLQGGWEILCDRFPEYAAVVGRLTRYVVPAADMPRGQGHSATRNNIPGGISMTMPADGEAAALTFVHEAVGHDRLNHLLLLARIDSGAATNRLFLAPWRDDPRPPYALVHGAMAHLQVAEYLRMRREHITDPTRRLLIDIEYARWRKQVLHTSRVLRDSGYLNEDGLALLNCLDEHTAGWQADQIQPEAERIARFLTADHKASWRLNNLAVNREALWTLQVAWQHRGVISGDTVAASIHGDRDVSRTGRYGREILLRRGIREAGYLEYLLENPQELPGDLPQSSLADVRLLTGSAVWAREEYCRMVREDPGNMDAWSGLAMTFFDEPDEPGAQILRETPEVVAGLAQQLGKFGFYPLDIAAWLQRLKLTVTIA